MSEPIAIGPLLRDPKFHSEIGGAFGFVDNAPSYCGHCGVDYEDLGLYVPGMKKAYPCTNRCREHRGEARVVKETDVYQVQPINLTKRWENVVGAGSMFLDPDFIKHPRTVNVGGVAMKAEDF